jgi:hypothetical protein
MTRSRDSYEGMDSAITPDLDGTEQVQYGDEMVVKVWIRRSHTS